MANLSLSCHMFFWKLAYQSSLSGLFSWLLPSSNLCNLLCGCVSNCDSVTSKLISVYHVVFSSFWSLILIFYFFLRLQSSHPPSQIKSDCGNLKGTGCSSQKVCVCVCVFPSWKRTAWQRKRKKSVWIKDRVWDHYGLTLGTLLEREKDTLYYLNVKWAHWLALKTELFT